MGEPEAAPHEQGEGTYEDGGDEKTREEERHAIGVKKTENENAREADNYSRREDECGHEEGAKEATDEGARGKDSRDEQKSIEREVDGDNDLKRRQLRGRYEEVEAGGNGEGEPDTDGASARATSCLRGEVEGGR